MPANHPLRQALHGFVAGFIATVVFHQLAVGLLWWIGLAPFGPFSLRPTAPLGVPAVLSLAFWGGVWGILFAWFHGRLPSGAAYWLSALAFGALLPSLVALLVVLPLKGQPVGAGWRPAIWLFAGLVNGAWGLGTALLLRGLERLRV